MAGRDQRALEGAAAPRAARGTGVGRATSEDPEDVLDGPVDGDIAGDGGDGLHGTRPTAPAPEQGERVVDTGSVSIKDRI